MEILYKIKDKIRERIFLRNREKEWYMKLYYSYWHMKYHTAQSVYKNYLTARPHPDPGVGHQMANWIAGYWFADFFGLNYAHMPFSRSRCGKSVTQWESFLGFGEGEKKAQELVQNEHYRMIRLPLFNEENQDEVDIIRKIIASYADQKVVFICEQDQFFKNQYLVSGRLQKKFTAAKPNRKGPYLFSGDSVNIAVHVRRGDIVQTSGKENNNLTMRWLDDGYYLKVIEQILNLIQTNKRIQIFIFSQGEKSSFSEYMAFPNVKLCLDVPAMDSFEHLCAADILITSKSSFSYKPALLNSGIKVCPEDFWHGYPDNDPNWIMVDDSGNLQNQHRIVLE